MLARKPDPDFSGPPPSQPLHGRLEQTAGRSTEGLLGRHVQGQDFGRGPGAAEAPDKEAQGLEGPPGRGPEAGQERPRAAGPQVAGQSLTVVRGQDQAQDPVLPNRDQGQGQRTLQEGLPGGPEQRQGVFGQAQAAGMPDHHLGEVGGADGPDFKQADGRIHDAEESESANMGSGRFFRKTSRVR